MRAQRTLCAAYVLAMPVSAALRGNSAKLRAVNVCCASPALCCCSSVSLHGVLASGMRNDCTRGIFGHELLACLARRRLHTASVLCLVMFEAKCSLQSLLRCNGLHYCKISSTGGGWRRWQPQPAHIISLRWPPQQKVLKMLRQAARCCAASLLPQYGCAFAGHLHLCSVRRSCSWVRCVRCKGLR